MHRDCLQMFADRECDGDYPMLRSGLQYLPGVPLKRTAAISAGSSDSPPLGSGSVPYLYLSGPMGNFHSTKTVSRRGGDLAANAGARMGQRDTQNSAEAVAAVATASIRSSFFTRAANMYV